MGRVERRRRHQQRGRSAPDRSKAVSFSCSRRCAGGEGHSVAASEASGRRERSRRGTVGSSPSGSAAICAARSSRRSRHQGSYSKAVADARQRLQHRFRQASQSSRPAGSSARAQGRARPPAPCCSTRCPRRGTPRTARRGATETAARGRLQGSGGFFGRGATRAGTRAAQRRRPRDRQRSRGLAAGRDDASGRGGRPARRIQAYQVPLEGRPAPAPRPAGPWPRAEKAPRPSPDGERGRAGRARATEIRAASATEEQGGRKGLRCTDQAGRETDPCSSCPIKQAPPLLFRAVS